MLKLFGTILVIAACTGIGFNKSLEIADHEEMIKQIRHMVILLKGEIRYGNSSLFLIFHNIMGKTTGVLYEFLNTLTREMKLWDGCMFSQMFEKCAKKENLGKYLTDEEYRRFLEFGKQLGGTDRETQIAQIDLYVLDLDRHMEELYYETREKKKLCRSMGVAGGIFLTLILW